MVHRTVYIPKNSRPIELGEKSEVCNPELWLKEEPRFIAGTSLFITNHCQELVSLERIGQNFGKSFWELFVQAEGF